jgi:hypothetical protein
MTHQSLPLPYYFTPYYLVFSTRIIVVESTQLLATSKQQFSSALATSKHILQDARAKCGALCTITSSKDIATTDSLTGRKIRKLHIAKAQDIADAVVRTDMNAPSPPKARKQGLTSQTPRVRRVSLLKQARASDKCIQRPSPMSSGAAMPRSTRCSPISSPKSDPIIDQDDTTYVAVEQPAPAPRAAAAGKRRSLKVLRTYERHLHDTKNSVEASKPTRSNKSPTKQPVLSKGYPIDSNYNRSSSLVRSKSITSKCKVKPSPSSSSVVSTSSSSSSSSTSQKQRLKQALEFSKRVFGPVESDDDDDNDEIRPGTATSLQQHQQESSSYTPVPAYSTGGTSLFSSLIGKVATATKKSSSAKAATTSKSFTFGLTMTPRPNTAKSSQSATSASPSSVGMWTSKRLAQSLRIGATDPIRRASSPGFTNLARPGTPSKPTKDGVFQNVHRPATPVLK